MLAWIWLVPSAGAFRPPATAADAWPAEAFPIRVEVVDCPLPGDACLEAARDAAADWAALPCTDLRAEVVAGVTPPAFGDGANQIGFGDPDGVVPPGLLGVARVAATEVDVVFAADLAFAPRADVLAGPCVDEIDLTVATTWALGLAFRLRLPDDGSPEAVRAFWDIVSCDAGRGSITPPAPSGVFDLQPGFDVVCGPENEQGLVLGRAPLQITCVASVHDPDPLFLGVDAIQWDAGDGAAAEGDRFVHTFAEGGVFQVRAGSTRGGQVCDPVRGRVSVPVTVCPVLAPDLTTDPPVGRTIRVRNRADPGAPGCGAEAAWTVHPGPDGSGDVILESTAWSPFLELPAAGVYTAAVRLIGEDGATGEGQITFEVGSGCGCAQTAPGPWTAWPLIAGLTWLAGSRRRPPPR